MSWNRTVQLINNNYQKVIYSDKIKQVVVIVNNLDDDFIQEIIDQHNSEMSKELEKGMYKGIDIMKQINKLKKPK